VKTPSYGWLGPLLVLLLMVGISIGTASWITRADHQAGALPTQTVSPAPRATAERHTPLTPRPVPFPPGALQEHPFPLDGAHASVACDACHAGGTYKGTAESCAACHPDPHDGVRGSNCEWCHNTTDFDQVSFDHANAVDCQGCHQQDAPPDHYAGQCSNCHLDTASWSTVQFNHTGFTDCQSCHANDAPPNHYAGQCSNCHTSTTSWPAVQFNHAGFTDCQSCHASDAPANHYAGQCSNCHTSTTSWPAVQFNHAGLTDCRSCHAAAAPANHFPGQCSDCHSTATWAGATFSHAFPLNHGRANGNCQTCHPGNNYASYTCYTCHDQGATAREHREEGISDLANCVRCHPTGGGEGD
jgi:hypothetical protein